MVCDRRIVKLAQSFASHLVMPISMQRIPPDHQCGTLLWVPGWFPRPDFKAWVSLHCWQNRSSKRF